MVKKLIKELETQLRTGSFKEWPDNCSRDDYFLFELKEIDSIDTPETLIQEIEEIDLQDQKILYQIYCCEDKIGDIILYFDGPLEYYNPEDIKKGQREVDYLQYKIENFQKELSPFASWLSLCL